MADIAESLAPVVPEDASTCFLLQVSTHLARIFFLLNLPGNFSARVRNGKTSTALFSRRRIYILEEDGLLGYYLETG